MLPCPSSTWSSCCRILAIRRCLSRMSGGQSRLGETNQYHSWSINRWICWGGTFISCRWGNNAWNVVFVCGSVFSLPAFFPTDLPCCPLSGSSCNSNSVDSGIDGVFSFCFGIRGVKSESVAGAVRSCSTMLISWKYSEGASTGWIASFRSSCSSI